MGPTSVAPDELQYLDSKRTESKTIMTHQTITKKGTFDSGHRVMNEKMKCFNLHGHTYHYELTFKFKSMESIGYAIDFKEIKRIGCQWIDDMLDHGTIVNPLDTHVITACRETHSKTWFMSLNGKDKYCNPSVENIAKEIFLAISFLLNSDTLKLCQLRLYETPNCFTDCSEVSITKFEAEYFYEIHKDELLKYKQEKGVVEYDDRK
jgi:6-pyruvoyltetrahydropterin/6-carboxytetrahydropterin synthase